MKSFRSRLATLLALVAMTAVTAVSAAAAETAETAEKTRTYGEAPTLETMTPIAELVADPERFEGRRVRVAGEVESVCPMKGCWMNLRQGDDLVRIKVEDDVIVFPADAVGAEATAEGEVELLEMTREQYVGWQEHLAEELGREFDPASIGEGPFTIVQIRGLGAEIEPR